MKKNLVLLLFSFLSISFILSQDNFDTWDYIFNGTCEPKQPRCLPYSKMSFSYIWDNYTEEQIISEANDWIKTQPNFNKKIHIDRSRAWFKKSLGVFLDEKANINDTIVSFHDNETYSSLLDFPHFKNMPYYEKDMEILKKINFNESDDSSILQAVMLLYHFYHFEDSPNKPDIRLFPRKPAVPLLLLSMYEVSLLDKDEAEKKVLEMRGYYINSFIKFHNKIVAANLTTDEFVHFFNRSNIHSDDWNYVFSLIFSYGISGSKEIDGKRVPTGFIAPIIRLTTHNKERDVNHKNVYNWQASKIANERELVFEVKEKLLKNDEIQIDSINRQYESWLNVGFLSKRADNCITINLVPKDIETTFKIPSLYIFLKKNLLKIYNFKILFYIIKYFILFLDFFSSSSNFFFRLSMC